MLTWARRFDVAAIAVVMVVATIWLAGCDQRPTNKPGAPATQSARGTAATELVEVAFKPPKKLFIGTPKDLKIDGPLEALSDKPRPAFFAPPGVVNLASKRPVTGSDTQPVIGALDYLTDGDREGSDGSFVELGPGLQWVQIDLGSPCEIWDVLLWHYHGDPRVYKDVIVQMSDDADFVSGVKTIFNNDHDGSAGMGVGADKMYVDSFEGKLIETKGQVRARYIRCYSNGSTSDEQNHYIEIEVYGVPGK